MSKLIIDNIKLKGLVSTLCREITLSDWRPDYIVGLTRGGLSAAVMLSHYFRTPMHSLCVSLREESESGPESNLWMAEDAYQGKHILVVDDINDSGATFNWIMKDWPSSCHPYGEAPKLWETIWGNNVRFAVLVDNLASQCDIGMFYVGMEINKAVKDVWVEFPWESWWK